jgi:hypothetical protein
MCLCVSKKNDLFIIHSLQSAKGFLLNDKKNTHYSLKIRIKMKLYLRMLLLRHLQSPSGLG